MQRMIAIVAVLLASCSPAPYELGTNPNATLYGVPGNSSCATPNPYSGTFAVLKLDDPISYGGIRAATSVELIMPERYFVQYGRYSKKKVKVVCELTESGLCGYPQIACAVLDMRVEP